MTPAQWLWLLVVVAVERTVILSAGAGVEVNVEEEIDVNIAVSRYHQGFPLRQDSMEGAQPASGVPRCLQERKTGLCRARVPRWYYDNASDTCELFTYGGCQGNDNNFRTEQQCRATCPDERPCSEDPSLVCRVSESSCVSAKCQRYSTAVCYVVPCSCEVIFVDELGKTVKCEEDSTTSNTTAITTSPTEANTTHSSTKPDATTSPVPGGDGGHDGGHDGLALHVFMMVVLVVVGFGMTVILLGVVMSLCSRPTTRSESTLYLNESPQEDTGNSTCRPARVSLYDIL